MNSCLLEGIISVKSAIEGNNRPIEKVYIDLKKRKQRDRKIMSFISYLNEKNVPYEFLEREKIDEISSKESFSGNTHGGVIAFAGERQYCDLEGMLKEAQNGEYFVYLDGVEDPYNFGYSLRAMYAMGASGFILPQRNMMSMPGAVARASAGASELCKIAIAPGNDTDAAKIIKDCGVEIVCSALANDSVSVFEFCPQKPFVLFIGGEKRGISKDFYDASDKKVHIPYERDVRYSLPTASVCAMYASHLSGLKNRKNQ